ncbi:MAG: hypothetical protein ABH824_00150 [Nanoarchaeota archaeon]|nr:hypothetical protein [Nanoarchaeota archaeon]
MESFIFEEGQEEGSVIDKQDHDSEEDDFLKSFEDEDEVEECAECGSAIRDKAVVRDFNGETLRFCSKECADEFEESVM